MPDKSFLTNLEKIGRRGRARPRQDNLKDVKVFRDQGVKDEASSMI
jgi:hypothetical protein